MSESITSPDVTVIVPVYNAGGKLSASLGSLVELCEQTPLAVEVIIVDDCSTDDSIEIARRFSQARANWIVVELARNSGSPSCPRNAGIGRASGRYVYFHDADDVLRPHGVEALVRKADEVSADLVRGWLEVDDGSGILRAANRVPGLEDEVDRTEIVRRLIGGQSTTCPSLVRTGLLRENGISWKSGVRLGEDTLFLAEVMRSSSVIRYVDVPTFVYNRTAQDVRSSTQTYDDAALRDHLHVWRTVQHLLSDLGVDYIALRGTVGVREALLSIISRRAGRISEQAFLSLKEFLRTYDDRINWADYKVRIRELYRVVRDDSYQAFEEAIKPRLLIAGYDLKFILPVIPRLQDHFDVAVDEWSGHERHDEQKSRRLLSWADVVFCDWLLGNAVWFAKNARSDQALIVRGHRFELERDYGFDPVLTRVDRFYSVSVKTLEDFIATFGFSRDVARLLPNWVDVDSYSRGDSDSRWFRLAIVGAVPDRKGLHRALEVLASLRRSDSRYELDVFGKSAHELDWIWRDPAQREYFGDCDRFIEMNGLSGAVHYRGWADMRSELADVGWVLSVSDDESFHLAPAEGFAAGACSAVLNWPGAEYIYPPESIFRSPSEIAQHISKAVSEGSCRAESDRGRRFVGEKYGVGRFVEELRDDIEHLLIRRAIR